MSWYNYPVIGGYTPIEDVIDCYSVHRTLSPLKLITTLQVYPLSPCFVRKGKKKIYIPEEEEIFHVNELECPFFSTETSPRLFIYPELVLTNGREYYINSPIRGVKIVKKNKKYFLLPNPDKFEDIYIIGELLYGKIKGAELVLQHKYRSWKIIFIKHRSYVNLYYETKQILWLEVKDRNWCGYKTFSEIVLGK